MLFEPKLCRFVNRVKLGNQPVSSAAGASAFSRDLLGAKVQ